MTRAWCCILSASVTRGHPEPDASASRVVVYPRDGHGQGKYRAPAPCSPRAARTMPLITEFKKLTRGSHSLLSDSYGIRVRPMPRRESGEFT